MVRARVLVVVMLSALLGAALLGLAPAGAETPTVDARLAEKLQLRLDSWRANHGVPGVAAAVRLPDDSLWIGVSGKAGLGADPRLVRPGTPFVIGSITKSFIAALVLQLQEEGRLSLRDPIAKWLPTYPNGSNITLRMLLNHRSGIFDYFAHPDYQRLVFGRPKHHWKVSEILALDGPPYFAPNQGFRYSNTNYVLLGRIIRKVTGRRPAALIRERFLVPLGMTRTFFQGDETIGRWPAKGYWKDGYGGYIDFSDGTLLRPHTSAATVAWAAGGIVASVRDLATWEHALFEGDVLAPGSLEEMLRFHWKSGYGLGIREQEVAGRPGYGHGGSLRGFVAGMYRLPKQDVDVLVLTNLGLVNTNGIIDGLAGTTLTWLANHPTPTPTPTPEPSVSTAPS